MMAPLRGHEAKGTKRSVRRILLPNSTPVPNFFFDDLLADGEIPHALRSVILFLWRKTCGWNKVSDGVSLTQIQCGASVSRHTALHAVKIIEMWGLFKVSRARKGTWNSYTIADFTEDGFQQRAQAISCMYDTICPTAKQLRAKPCTEGMILAEIARIRDAA